MKNKRGLSAVITTLIMIALVIVLITIVWISVDRMAKGAMEGSESCFDIAGKANINNAYTCWDGTDLQFSVSLKDINPDSILVTVSTIETTKSYKINADGLSTYSNVKNYDGTYGGELTALTNNSGRTYVTNDFTSRPDSIELFLIFGEKQCSVSAALYEIRDC